MKKKFKIIFFVVIILGFITLAAWYLHGTNIAVLNPKGPIARKERDLIYTALALALIVVIPVFSLTAIFVWRYREGNPNKKVKYSPELSGNKIIETIWWLIPSAIIAVLAVITWHATYTLNPYTPIASKNPGIPIQVVALDWKWLFIYPNQNIASVNFLEFPKNTPISFELTADAPMNSFWIPQLSGQIYAMPGMSTKLNLMATSYGTFRGLSANLSGAGFSGMSFSAKSTTVSGFENWVASVKRSTIQLGANQYNLLAQPSQNNPPSYYSSAESGLYAKIIDKYMVPANQTGSGNMGSMSGMGNMGSMDMQ
jgi:cytochrome o ubiquinol oxidase subunit 2